MGAHAEQLPPPSDLAETADMSHLYSGPPLSLRVN